MLAVVEGCSCPSQSAITVTSVPDSNNLIARMPQSVHANPFRPQRGAGAARGREVTGETVFDRVLAQAGAGVGREQRIARVPAAFGEPDAQHPDGQRCQRCRAFLTALADAVHVRAGAEGDIGDGEAGQLGDPQPGLGREHEHRVVTPPGPGGPVGRGQQRVDLGLGEPGDQVASRREGDQTL